MASDPAAAGDLWEQEFVLLARTNGYTARKVSGDRPHDAIVNGLKVQCKNVSYERDGVVRIGKSYGKGTRRYRRTDFDILALNFRGKRFFIPAASLCGQDTRWPQSVRLARYWRYCDNWEVFSDAGAERDSLHQMALFEGDE